MGNSVIRITDGEGDRQELDVAFAGMGIKRLLQVLAPIEKSNSQRMKMSTTIQQELKSQRTIKSLESWSIMWKISQLQPMRSMTSVYHELAALEVARNL